MRRARCARAIAAQEESRRKSMQVHRLRQLAFSSVVSPDSISPSGNWCLAKQAFDQVGHLLCKPAVEVAHRHAGESGVHAAHAAITAQEESRRKRIQV